MTGYEVAVDLNCDPNEGVLVAVLPSVIDEILTKELPDLDNKDDRFHLLLATLGPWGEMALDALSPNDEPVKWWRAKEMMSGHNIIPIRWQGPIGEIPQQYFEGDYVLAVRFYQHGPWFFPREQPTVKTDSTLLEAVEATNES